MSARPPQSHAPLSLSLATVLTLAMLVTGCGGGGGNSGGGNSPSPSPSPSPTPTPTPTPPLTPPPVTPPPFPRSVSDPTGFTFPTVSNFDTLKAGYESDSEYRIAYMSSGGGSGVDDHLGMINAADAYARGATGSGETVVIVDSGFYMGHREFSGSGKFTIGASFGADCTPEEIRLRTCSPTTHGTLTSSTAAGNRDAFTDLNMHGVAFDANIIGIRVRLGAGGRTTLSRLPDLSGFDDNPEVGFYERLLYKPNADNTGYDHTQPWGFVVNMSFSTPHGLDSFTRDDVRAAFPNLAALYAQADTNPADRIIIVRSAGNSQGRRYDRDFDGDGELDTCLGATAGAMCPGGYRNEMGAGDPLNADSPVLVSALGAHFPELQGHLLTVVAVQQRGTTAGVNNAHIGGFSNKCGNAKGFCIAAPGVGMVGARPNPSDDDDDSSYTTWSGTSAAAPLVTGALAVMRSFFRNPDDGTPALGNTELVTRLLATADRTNYNADNSGGPDYSDSDTYGHGLLDLDAATRPVGMLSTSMHGNGDAGSVGMQSAGGAFGNAITGAISGATVALYDELNAPFFTSVDAWLRRANVRAADTAAGSAATAAGNAFSLSGSGDGISRAAIAGSNGGGDWWAGWNGGGGGVPFLAFVGDGPGGGIASGDFAWRIQHGAPTIGGRAVDADWRDGTALSLRWRALRLGLMRENDGVLGTRPTGAMGHTAGTTAFAGAGWHWRKGAWQGTATAWLGTTDTQTHPGLLRTVSDIASDAFAVTATRGGLTLSLAQPLRVRSGSATFQFPTGRTRYGEMMYRRDTVNLKPTGRSVEAKAMWRGRLWGGGGLDVALSATREPNHDAAAGVAGEGWIGVWGRF